MSIEYAPSARHDLLNIWDHHAQRTNENVADEMLQRIKDTLERLIAQHPHAGRVRPEFGKNIRSFPVLPYTVFYRVERRYVYVQRILHGHRDIRPPLMSLLVAG